MRGWRWTYLIAEPLNGQSTDRDQYEGLVRQIEAEAEHNPGGFRNQVLLISSAAYVALTLILSLLTIYFGA